LAFRLTGVVVCLIEAWIPDRLATVRDDENSGISRVGGRFAAASANILPLRQSILPLRQSILRCWVNTLILGRAGEG
jgi:hypothetical protein